MKKILIAGPGNTGSGVILDCLVSRDDAFLAEEFGIVNDPGGIQNLEESINDNFDLNYTLINLYKFRKNLSKDEISI